MITHFVTAPFLLLVFFGSIINVGVSDSLPQHYFFAQKEHKVNNSFTIKVTTH